MGSGSTANTNGQATTPNNNGSGDRQQLSAGTSSGSGTTTMDSLKPEMTPQQQQHRSLASEDIWEWLKLSPMVPFCLGGHSCCCCYCFNRYHFPFHFLFCYVFRDVSRLVLVLQMISVCWTPTLTAVIVAIRPQILAVDECTWIAIPTNRHQQQD